MDNFKIFLLYYRLKFNIVFNCLKFNICERKIGLILKFFNVDQIRINVITEAMQPDTYITDRVMEKNSTNILKRIQERIGLSDTYKYKKHKLLNGTDKSVTKNPNPFPSTGRYGKNHLRYPPH